MAQAVLLLLGGGSECSSAPHYASLAQPAIQCISVSTHFVEGAREKGGRSASAAARERGSYNGLGFSN